ncbi:MAG: amino acid adenylation domain-containing protein, partial [Anaerolineae bacterium]|nr:amino acid adenylation domain-containing protein [Anaerolineae bacterium]
LSRMMPRELIDRVRALGYAENATLFMVLTAALEVLLYRYSGQEDLCIGTPIANRNQAEAEQLIGLFINTLVLRDDLSGDPTFRALLARVRETALGAYAHQDLPFEMLVEELKPERDMSHSPLFQVMLILQNAPVTAHELPNLKLSTLDVHSGTSTFDLTLSMSETPDGLHASVEYNTDLFDAATMDRLLRHYRRLLESIVADPDEHISRLNMLGDAERHELLTTWNDTSLRYPEELCVHELFALQAERDPDAVAVVHAGEQLTYGELNRRANQLAHYLQKRGVSRGTLVGICVERSLEALIGIMGILKAGGAYVPMDPDYPQERLAFMLQNAEMPVLITQQHLAGILAGDPAANDEQGRVQAQVISLDTDWSLISKEPEQPPLSGVTPDELAYVIYTSGSTGQPKGVMISHGSLANAYYAWETAYELRTRVNAHLQMASMAFDVFTGDMVRALCSGGKLVLCPREILLDGAALYTLIQAEEIDCAEFVPVVLRQLMQHLEQSGQSLDDMRLVICGSDSWYVAEYTDFLRFCGPETRLINSFGLTEATIDSSYFEAQALHLSGEQLLPIGRPFANMQLYILDAHMQPLPIGVPGELYVGGKGLARGYLGQPDLTAERFVTAPFGARLYKTGDMARYLPDGNIQFLGRMDNQVKIRGFRIELGEVEAVLAQHPAVASAAVIAREDTPGDQRLAAYLVAAAAGGPAGQLPSSGELRRYVQDRLPDYMVPSAFVALEALPLTPNGKIDRRALPMPDWGQRDLESDYIAPRTPVEADVAAIFAEVLGMERVGIHDSFFELGGHSLLATQLVSRIRERLDVDLPLRRVFESPTVATMAEHVEIAQRTGVQ